MGPLQYYFLHGQASGLGHLLKVMHEYNAESPKQGRKRFNYIVKTIYFSCLPVLTAAISSCGSSQLPCEVYTKLLVPLFMLTLVGV